ncbi:Uncharacterized protein dnm_077970 [Desulfonema magnum]|uniref:Uncharacterized protein n=1 Tax=Desulfonema magnum TaxID=45655 RepID=A0A975GT41_9BACT|nr:Uncharacterized protein dnm_077970 [Desulfonema magnum]
MRTFHFRTPKKYRKTFVQVLTSGRNLFFNLVSSEKLKIYKRRSYVRHKK